MFPITKSQRQVAYYKAKIHLQAEASKTYLSALWWAIEPIISMAIYYLVFKVIFQRGTDDFVPFLLIGLVSWQWFSNSVTHCANSINGNTTLVTLLNFPEGYSSKHKPRYGCS